MTWAIDCDQGAEMLEGKGKAEECQGPAYSTATHVVVSQENQELLQRMHQLEQEQMSVQPTAPAPVAASALAPVAVAADTIALASAEKEKSVLQEMVSRERARADKHEKYAASNGRGQGYICVLGLC